MNKYFSKQASILLLGYFNFISHIFCMETKMYAIYLRS